MDNVCVDYLLSIDAFTTVVCIFFSGWSLSDREKTFLFDFVVVGVWCFGQISILPCFIFELALLDSRSPVVLRCAIAIAVTELCFFVFLFWGYSMCFFKTTLNMIGGVCERDRF